jgi:hypothetical protein
MIIHPMNNRDAMRSVMVQVPAANVKFTDPALDMFFADERAGLCAVVVKRLPPIVTSDQQHTVEVTYYDPEIEFVKRLSI